MELLVVLLCSWSWCVFGGVLLPAPVRLQACSGAQKLGKSFVNAFFALKCLAPRATKHVCCYSQSFVWPMSELIDGARFLGSLELLMEAFKQVQKRKVSNTAEKKIVYRLYTF